MVIYIEKTLDYYRVYSRPSDEDMECCFKNSPELDASPRAEGYADAWSRMSGASVCRLWPEENVNSISAQLATAIEETLIVYHEPTFIRWACRMLRGNYDGTLAAKAIKIAVDNPASAAEAAFYSIQGGAACEVEAFASMATEAALHAQDEVASP